MPIGRVLAAIAVVAAGYVLLGGALHTWILPERIPESFYPEPGDEFTDSRSGEILRIHGAPDGRTWGEFVIQPGGQGPPVHVHAHTEERVEVVSGIMSARIGGSAREYGPGELIVIPPGTPHKFFNPGDAPAVTRADGGSIPPILALCVTQFWGMLNDPGFMAERSFALQALLMSPRCDIWDERMPLPLQRALAFGVAPTARIFGYRLAYPEYAGTGGRDMRRGHPGSRPRPSP